jgi:hypothetical protein
VKKVLPLPDAGQPIFPLWVVPRQEWRHINVKAYSPKIIDALQISKASLLQVTHSVRAGLLIVAEVVPHHRVLQFKEAGQEPMQLSMPMELKEWKSAKSKLVK